jgi:hypothetical protein
MLDPWNPLSRPPHLFDERARDVLDRDRPARALSTTAAIISIHDSPRTAVFVADREHTRTCRPFAQLPFAMDSFGTADCHRFGACPRGVPVAIPLRAEKSLER